LSYINSNALLAESLVLKGGGTAINLTIFDLPRLSVDIDLDFYKNMSREEMLASRELLGREILGYMAQSGFKLSPGSKNPHSLDSWSFSYKNAAGNRDNLKVEINYSMRAHLFPVIKVKPNISILPIIDEIKVLAPLELFGSKIKALIERTAIRDFNNFESVDNLKFPQIRASLIPVLRKSEKFDFENAKTIAKEFLLKIMVPTDSEREFISEFNKKRYLPELLFNDRSVIERIKQQPMAL